MNTRKFVKSNAKVDINFALKGLWNEIDALKAQIAALSPTNEGSEEISDEGASVTEVATETEAPAEVETEAPAEVETETEAPAEVAAPVEDEVEVPSGPPADLGLEAIQFVNACEDRTKLYEYCLTLEEPITLKRNKSLADMKVDALEHINS